MLENSIGEQKRRQNPGTQWARVDFMEKPRVPGALHVNSIVDSLTCDTKKAMAKIQLVDLAIIAFSQCCFADRSQSRS